MSICATKHALAITNRLPFILDDTQEVTELIDGLLGHETECSVEFWRALELVREGFITKHAWMGLAIFPDEWRHRPGAPSAWVAHHEERHGETVECPVVDPALFVACEHPAPSQTVLVRTPYGLIPLDQLPPDVQRALREQMGIDDDDD
jgi:hypothetical protein